MNILIVKLSAIGDVIHTLPVLNAVRKCYPDAHITWLVEEAASSLIEGHTALHRVLVSKRKISKKIMAKFETETYIIFKDETLLKAFTNFLIQNDIPYQTIDLGNTDGVKIFWDPIYDSKVVEIKDEFFRTIYAKKPPVIKVENDQILNNLEALLTEKGIYYKVVDCHSAIGGKCINYNSDDYKDIQDFRMIARDMARNKNVKEP